MEHLAGVGAERHHGGDVGVEGGAQPTRQQVPPQLLHGVKVVGARKAAQQMVVDVHVGYENLCLAVGPKEAKA